MVVNGMVNGMGWLLIAPQCNGMGTVMEARQTISGMTI
jgi:hypothetical protein